jgi:diaminopimelate decarboxylase/aspartate kinase
MSSSLLVNAEAWLVLKFGGTSVSNPTNWHNIARVLRARAAEGFRPVVVHSALSGITDRLETLLSAALNGSHLPILGQIELAHRSLAERLSITPNARFEQFVRELRELIGVLAERRSIGDAARARVMAMGELLATTLGAEFLNRHGVGRRAHRAACRRASQRNPQGQPPVGNLRIFPRPESSGQLACPR